MAKVRVSLRQKLFGGACVALGLLSFYVVSQASKPSQPQTSQVPVIGVQKTLVSHAPPSIDEVLDTKGTVAAADKTDSEQYEKAQQARLQAVKDKVKGEIASLKVEFDDVDSIPEMSAFLQNFSKVTELEVQYKTERQSSTDDTATKAAKERLIVEAYADKIMVLEKSWADLKTALSQHNRAGSEHDSLRAIQDLEWRLYADSFALSITDREDVLKPVDKWETPFDGAGQIHYFVIEKYNDKLQDEKIDQGDAGADARHRVLMVFSAKRLEQQAY